MNHTPPPETAPPRPVRALIADDERLMREQLRNRLAEVWPELQIVAEARNGIEAVALVQQHRPDLVFMDIRMPGLSGVEAARQIAQLDLSGPAAEGTAPCPPGSDAGHAGSGIVSGDSNSNSNDNDSDSDSDVPLPEIVFITAYDEYAVQAFEQGAADYVLKPAERERLALTVARIRRRLALRDAQPAPGVDNASAAAAVAAMGSSGATRAGGDPDAQAMPLQQLLHRLAAQLNPQQAAPRYLEWIQASVGPAIQMIPVAEVLFFVSDEKYTRVQTATLEALIRKPIKELVDELDPQLFWQIHRSTLVAVKAIAGVSRDFRGRQIVAVKGHTEKLEVSRSYGHLFKGM